jgi:arylsulfatase A-like enzyme
MKTFYALTAAALSYSSLQASPNVLLIIADDLGWNGVGFHSRSMSTPNLDRLAKDGTELQRYYTYPVCSPSRAALLTGQMPRRFGLAHIIAPGQEGIPKGTITLPATFKAAGYRTSLIGKWHLGSVHPPQEHGFDHFYGFMGAEIDYFKHTGQRGERIDWQRDGRTLEEEGYSTYLLADEAIRQIKQRDTRKPFLIQVAFNAPHFPLAAPDELVSKHRGNLYSAVIAALDTSIGRILTALDEQKMRENTLVMFCSDNGAPRRSSSNEPLRYGKESVYEGGIRTPCVMRWPGKVPAGSLSQQPVSAQDLLPTLAAAAGVNLPANSKLDGTSQWTALQTSKAMPREPVLIASADTALIDGEWKLIEWTSGNLSLFNLRSDIGETKDLYAKEAERARQLTAKLYELKQALPPLRASSGPKGKAGPKGKGRPPPRQ